MSELNAFSQLVGSNVNCAVLFNDSVATWADWAKPWFLTTSNPDYKWAAWKTSNTNRRLLITQAMFPSSMTPASAFVAGGSATAKSYATQLAKNLVAAGLGDSYIRIANEANGVTNRDIFPSAAAQQKQWMSTYRAIVQGMRAVKGANFKFIWTVVYGVRGVQLNAFYPGDDVTDMVGLDPYDDGWPGLTPQGRWNYDLTRPQGIKEVAAFARQQGKPLAFPEWGLMPGGPNARGGGDNPTYVAGIQSIMASENVAMQGYWYAHQDTMTVTNQATNSLPLLRSIFKSGK